MISRRRFITGFVIALTPLAATASAQEYKAQQAGKVYRVGLILITAPLSEMAGLEPANALTRGFVQGLRALDYVEGQNLILERRSAEGRYERFGEIVAELVRLRADVIVTTGTPMTRVAKAVTTSVPIVMTGVTNPVGEGIVQSLARPGGNITGLTSLVGPEFEAKRLELLKELLPGVSRVAYLASKENNDWEASWGKSVRAAAQALGVTLVLAEHTPQQYTDAFTLFSRARAEALFVSGSPTAYVDRALIVDFATRTRLPSSFAYRESVDLGGLMSYGVSLSVNGRRAATFVDKILKGAKPSDLPIEQPTKFELVINLKTAKALGLTIPTALLQRADQVIE
jgi:putative ABC transport system substrate-binding protein